MIIEIKKISELTPAPYNPRESTEKQESQLKQSLKKFGVVEPIIYNKQTGYIVGGHFRVRELQKLGYTEIECVIVDLSEEDEKELNIRLNANTGQWDWDELANNFELDDLNDWGLEVPNMKHELEAEDDNFDVDADSIETDIVVGDLFEIGEHRLLCGDSTDSDVVGRLMDGEKADIAFTSPPYNAGKNVRGNFYENDNDDKSNDDYVKFLYDFTINTLNNSTYSFVNLQLLESNKHALIEYQYQLKEQIKDVLIWNKSQYPPHINKGTFGCKWEYVFALCYESKSRGFPCTWQGKFSNVIETENASGNEFADIHKATFPISFPSWVISKMDFAKSVLDVFMGTGTTMVASHQLKRKCYGMELDPKYCQVIVDRMRKLDPTIKIKRNGVEI
jgi:DNA modification methylase